MHEHFTHAIYYFEVHLIYSSIVWLAAWALTSIPGGSGGPQRVVESSRCPWQG